MKIFYHIDNDGKLAAFLVKEHYKKIWSSERMGTVKGYPINYGMEFPFEEIEPNELVYIVDYSISPEEMRQLHSITENIVWIDHHKTAIEKYANFEIEIDGLRSVEASGCVLTYCYLDLMDEYTMFDYERMKKSIPTLVKYIGAHDVGITEYPGEYVNYGVQTCNTDPFDENCIWNSIMDVDASDPIMRVVIDRGRGALDMLDIMAKDIMKFKSFTCTFHGYKSYAVNMARPYANSKWFDICLSEEEQETADLYIVFSYNGEHYTYTLFRGKLGLEKDIDVSAIAVEYGGGGHKGAAAFSVPEMLLHKEVSKSSEEDNITE